MSTSIPTTRAANPLALGFVILVGAACALGTIFIVIVLGLFDERRRRRREGYGALPLDKRDAPERTRTLPFVPRPRRVPPEELLGPLRSSSRSNSPAPSTQRGRRSRRRRRIASSLTVRSSIRSFTSFFSDSTSGWGSRSSGSTARTLSSNNSSRANSVASSRASSWADFMSTTSNAEDPEWHVDEVGMTARLKVMYGEDMEMRPVVSPSVAKPGAAATDNATGNANGARLGRVSEEWSGGWI